MRASHIIVKSTNLLSLIIIFSLSFGFIKEIVPANHFGSGDQVDAFLIAAIIPLSTPGILILVISLRLILAYIEAQGKQREQTQNLLNFIMSYGCLLSLRFISRAVSSMTFGEQLLLRRSINQRPGIIYIHTQGQ